MRSRLSVSARCFFHLMAPRRAVRGNVRGLWFPLSSPWRRFRAVASQRLSSSALEFGSWVRPAGIRVWRRQDNSKLLLQEPKQATRMIALPCWTRFRSEVRRCGFMMAMESVPESGLLTAEDPKDVRGIPSGQLPVASLKRLDPKGSKYN